MYKVIFSIVVYLFFNTIQAQDVKTASKLFDAGDMPAAKKAIDAAIAGAQTNLPEAWVVKHKIYWAISNSSQSKIPLTDIKLQGYNALVKAYNMPKGQEAMFKEMGSNLTAPFQNYYSAFIDDGSASMGDNDNKNAFTSFKAALGVIAFYYENKMVSSPLDTMLTFYAGYTAMKNNDFTNAEYYFKQLSDANASGTDYQIAYGWLSNYYVKDKKDAASAKSVCDKGLAHYPKDEYLLSVKTEIARASGSADNLFSAFEETISKGNAGFSDYLSYGAELYDYLYVNEDKHTITNTDAKEKKLEEVLTKAISLKTNSAEANYILGMHYYSKAFAKNAEAKATTDAVQKAGLKESANESINQSVLYLEVATTFYEAKKPFTEKIKQNYKSAVQLLVNLYNYLKKQDKKAETEKRLQGL